MSGTLIQLHSASSAPADLAIKQIAQLLGIEVVRFARLDEALAEIKRQTSRQSKVAFAANAALSRSFRSDGDPVQRQILNEISALCDSLLHSFPLEDAGSALSFGHGPTDIFPRVGRHKSRLRTYKFGRALPDSPLSGLTFETECAEDPVLFEPESVPNAVPLITVNDRPLLLSRTKKQHHDYFLSQGPRIDLDAALIPPRVASDFYAELLPVAFALRTIFGSACWHNPFPIGCVIVDDPLLREQYGFFKYSEILQELVTHQYSLTLAFIPSNFKRSDPEVTGSMSRHRDHISICVHGCHHTSAEFGETNPASIENKAATALAKMDQHKALTGLPFDRVMVFPQGVFSSHSPRALRKCGYLAAVNTTPYPTDYFESPTAIADLFTLAIVNHSSFPIFTRHYPQRAFDFAVDLFWGKPLFVVEHHNYFREGPCRLSEFVQALNELNPEIQWLTVENAVIRSGQYKRTGENTFSVRFLTSKFVLRNPLTIRCSFLCSKPESKPADVQRVSVDGRVFPHKAGENHISLELTLEGGEERTITIEYRPMELRTFEMPMAYRFNAFVRRRLSEFRDNYLSKHEGLLQVAVWLKNHLLGRNEPRNFSPES